MRKTFFVLTLILCTCSGMLKAEQGRSEFLVIVSPTGIWSGESDKASTLKSEPPVGKIYVHPEQMSKRKQTGFWHKMALLAYPKSLKNLHGQALPDSSGADYMAAKSRKFGKTAMIATGISAVLLLSSLAFSILTPILVGFAAALFALGAGAAAIKHAKIAERAGSKKKNGRVLGIISLIYFGIAFGVLLLVFIGMG